MICLPCEINVSLDFELNWMNSEIWFKRRKSWYISAQHLSFLSSSSSSVWVWAKNVCIFFIRRWILVLLSPSRFWCHPTFDSVFSLPLSAAQRLPTLETAHEKPECETVSNEIERKRRLLHEMHKYWMNSKWLLYDAFASGGLFALLLLDSLLLHLHGLQLHEDYWKMVFMLLWPLWKFVSPFSGTRIEIGVKSTKNGACCLGKFILPTIHSNATGNLCRIVCVLWTK